MKLQGYIFDLDKYSRIHDLIPRKKNFSLDDADMLDPKGYFISIQPKWILYPVQVYNKDEKSIETIFVDYDTAKIIADTFHKTNTCNKKDVEITRYGTYIKTLDFFTHIDLNSYEKFLYQNIDGQQIRIYWKDGLEILDLKNTLYHLNLERNQNFYKK